jgi:type I restriction enzyme M protein
MLPEHIDKIVAAVSLRADIERFAHVATLQEIKDNDYNLNIPRYVDRYVPEPIPDLMELLSDLGAIEKEIEDL